MGGPQTQVSKRLATSLSSKSIWAPASTEKYGWLVSANIHNLMNGSSLSFLHNYKRKVSSFYAEVELYQCLWELPNLCGLSRLCNIFTDKSTCHTGIVLDYVGIDLDELFSLCRRSWSIATVGRIWSMLIDRIEAVHVCGFVLRYVKGANLCMGGESGTTLFVIDLAGAKQYLDQDSKHFHAKTVFVHRETKLFDPSIATRDSLRPEEMILKALHTQCLLSSMAAGYPGQVNTQT
jgi:hypothetical protein